MAITLKDVAKASGVSESTVSRVINNDSRISNDTKQKVLKYINKMGYQMNAVARGLRTNKTYLIGMITPSLTNSFFMEVAMGIDEYLSKRGYTLIICNTNESVEQEKKKIESLRQQKVDGFIIIPCSAKGTHLQQIKADQTPAVLVDRLVSDLHFDAVLVDNHQGAYDATQFMIKKGYKKIGFIGGDLNLLPAKERYEGYLHCLHDNHLAINDCHIKFGKYKTEDGYNLMKEILNQEDSPEIVFASNYYSYIGALRYLLNTVSVDDISRKLYGFDNLDVNKVFKKGLIRIGQPMKEIGEMAAELLLSKINNKNNEVVKTVRLATKLITE